MKHARLVKFFALFVIAIVLASVALASAHSTGNWTYLQTMKRETSEDFDHQEYGEPMEELDSEYMGMTNETQERNHHEWMHQEHEENEESHSHHHGCH